MKDTLTASSSQQKKEKTTVGIPPMGTMKVLCDQMLGSLATWLRILGIDTMYPSNDMSDDEILQIAAEEQRLIISRDKQLIARGKKRMIPVLELETTNLDEQLAIVTQAIPIETTQLLSRCTLCNTQLHSVKKDDVAGKIPPKVLESQKDFWYCPHCKKYYWMGTHYQNMMQKITRLTKQNHA
jgi:uncharacterized protein with PIN domain